jgi:thiol-disulfide isomerase/thioredoxin
MKAVLRSVFFVLLLSISIRTQAQITVYIFITPDCPICKYYIPKLHQLALRYQDAACQLYYVVPSKYLSDKEKRKYNRELKKILKGANEHIYINSTDSLCTLLNAKITPEVFVLDSASNIIYSGAIDDKYSDVLTHKQKTQQFYLQQAIDAGLKNQKPLRLRVEPVGCIISR